MSCFKFFILATTRLIPSPDKIYYMDGHLKCCKKCGDQLTSDNWDDVWKSINVKICNRCKDVWVKKSLRNDEQRTCPDNPYAQQRPDRVYVGLRDRKYKILTGTCSKCGKESNDTVRHHLWYPVTAYDPESIIELCQACHNKEHTKICSMPIIN